MLAETSVTRIPIIFDTLLTLLLFTLGAALGLRLLRRLRIPLTDTLERGLFAATVGMGVLSYLPFALFAVGAGRPVVLMSVTLLLALLFVKDEIRVVRGAVGLLTKALRRGFTSGPAWSWILTLAVAPHLLTIFLKALCPPTDTDGLHYHLTAPVRYLDLGRFVYLPSFLHLNWPLGVEMLFGIGMAFHRNYAASLIEFGFGLLLILSTYVVGRRIASPLVGWLAALLVLNYQPMAIAYIDVGLSQYTLLSVYAFFLGWKSLQTSYKSTSGDREEETSAGVPSKRKEPAVPSLLKTGADGAASTEATAWWRLSALLMGMAAAAKLSAIVPLLLMTVMVFWAELSFASRRSEIGKAQIASTLRSSLSYLIWGLVVVAPWYIRSWVQAGDPLYPFLWSIFKPRDWNLAAHLRLNEYLQYFITLPSLHLSPEGVRKIRVLACCVLAIFGVIGCLWRATRAIRPFVVFFFAAVFLQVATSGIYLRYLLPLLPFAMLLFLWLFRGLLARSETAKVAGALLVALVIWLPPKALFSSTVADIRTALPVAFGTVTRDTYLTRNIPVYPVMEWSNQNLPPDAVVLLGLPTEAFGALLHRKALVSKVWLQGALRFDDWDTLLADLHRHGATHLILHEVKPPSPEEIAAMDREGQVRATIEYPKLARLSVRYGIPVYHYKEFTVYALHWDKPEPP
ncbi:MAG: hypothetical protein JWL77_3371 [Chthonomonadaceae bacterium]|nr:hypothetical protein [Chthonomonadaceae bacterium]